MSTLYVVATPIGNLGDITLRAVEVLKSVPLIAAEDTRVTRKLLNHIDSKARTLSYNENSPPARLRELLSQLESGNLALVTDAGTPAISDPGSELVREAARAGHDIVPVPGVSSVTTALSVSGFDSTGFTFLGFLPRRKTERVRELRRRLELPVTLVFLESPHRIHQALEDLAAVAGERTIAVCRELTKLHEEVYRGTAADALDYFSEPRGEFVVVVSPAASEEVVVSDEEIVSSAAAALAEGQHGRSAVERVIAETGAPRARVYPLVMSLQKQK